MADMPPAESDLVAQLQQLRAVLDHVGAYVFTKDMDGRYTYVNAMVCELFGLPCEAVVGRTDEDFFDLQRSHELRINDLHVLEGGERIEREETNVIAASGETRVYWTVKMPLHDSTGRIVGMCGISTDITERRRLEQQLREQKQLLDSLLDNIDACIYMKDRERRYRYANAQVAELFGLPQEAIAGKRDEDMLPAVVAEGFSVADLRVLQDDTKVCTEETFLETDGDVRHYWTIKIPMHANGGVDGLIGVSTDITDVVRLKDEFQRLARTDALTGIANRRHLLELAEHELKRSRRQRSQVALVFFDIDHFKPINDGLGHGVGDRVLQHVSQLCRMRLRETDLFGRLGGDEFLLVLPDAQADDAQRLAEELRGALADSALSDRPGEGLSVTCSFGIALSEPDESLDSLISRADAALYRAKALGRNRVWLGVDGQQSPALKSS